ncbi:2Fe-2S iron-sulfur cluster-binding protein [Tomitella fengzijianii]|uniref:2Fe-2S iron-sulfur cluster binding domain-containing protein n=1 Tax=Tomitella fengzijianii TaxID=2597660 RepID=A0A516X577_9ACTN|nr:2Fe-2S iron-sulfur cluster-binding protein [Tomitella fengzijianii]QDQ98219.1 2Fe-2S iron-sulfur cluster binding domain-containing protein [Tomitella fengzijianii]
MTEYTVAIEPLGAEVTCREDQTVLDACLREGIWLPHACTHGTCGTCKAEVLEGEVNYGDASPYALLESEREEGAALLCVATPREDLTVEAEVDVEEGVDIHPVRDYTGVIESVEEAGPRVRKVIIAADTPVSFNPGQYVSLASPTGEVRPYSIASTPQDPSRIELHIQLSDGGVVTEGWVFKSLAAGDRVSFTGPYGKFSWRPLREQPVVLLGSGTGLAPLKSMVRHVAETGSGHQVVLYHGVATRDDLYDKEFFTELDEQNDWFSYRPALSKDTWNDRTGRVPALLAEDYPRAAGNVAYICGNPAMVTDTMKALMKARLFPRDIYREDFFDSADRAAGTNVVRSPLIKR